MPSFVGRSFTRSITFAAVGLTLIVALVVASTARAAEDAAGTAVATSLESASASAHADVTQLAEQTPPPDGLTRVAVRIDALNGGDPPEYLTIAESKFNGPAHTAVTVMYIKGGTWDRSAELQIGGTRVASQVMVGGADGVLRQGTALKEVLWQRPDGVIVQIVARGQITAEQLMEYASTIEGMNS